MSDNGDTIDHTEWLPGSVPDPVKLGSLVDLSLGLTSIQASPDGLHFVLVATGNDATVMAFDEGLWGGISQPGRLDPSDVIVRTNRGDVRAQLNVDDGQEPALRLMGTHHRPGRFEARIHAKPAPAASLVVSVDWRGDQVSASVAADAIAAAVERSLPLA